MRVLATFLLPLLLASDPEIVADALARIGGSRLAVVSPVHSHFDHALDSPEVAKQTGAVVLGSETTANIARGQGLPEAQIVVVEPGRDYSFGRFTVTLHVSAHAPIADGGPPMPGTVDEPLPHPAKMSAFKEGGSYSIVVSHPSGTALVHGSAGFVEGALAGVTADRVFLGTGGLASLEEEDPGYIARYWDEIVVATGARKVHPIHHDDFTLPFGSFRAFPSLIAGDLDDSLAPLAALAMRDGVRFEMLPLLEPVGLLGAP